MQENFTNKIKKTSESRVTTSYIIMPSDMNRNGVMYGGKLLDYADNLAGSVAVKHSRCKVSTASVDSFDFLKSFKLGQFLIAEAFISGVGSKSMEVFIKFLGEDTITGERFLGAYCFYTFVATSLEKGEVLPKIIPQTEEETTIMQGYENRRQRNLERLKRNNEFINSITLK